MPFPEASEIEALIASGEDRRAVKRAKSVHERMQTAGSERLLVRAYLARILAFLDRGLLIEARELIDLVERRYPSSAPHLEEARAVFILRTGGIDELLRLLSDPTTPAETRSAVEMTIQRRVTDLDALARSEVLPPDHPIRNGGAALATAMARVTGGPVVEDALVLPEISHRSPLAPWKSLVRAIAAFYCGDDGRCQRHLEAIPPAAAPARLVPALRALCGARKHGGPLLGAAASTLVFTVGGASSDQLRVALRELDVAFRGNRMKAILAASERAASECARACPDLLDRLRQHVSIKAWSADVPPAKIRSAMGCASVKDAHFWRLFARTVETRGTPPLACSYWEIFRRHAIREGWFSGNGTEAAALYLHMAGLWHSVSPRVLGPIQQRVRKEYRELLVAYNETDPDAHARGFGDPADPEVTDFADPESLYARAAALDPSAEIFRSWLEWATFIDRSGKKSEAAALAWTRARPAESRPLLFLLERAERRGALKKALGYLEAAEKIDRFHPQVRRARTRLLVASALRQLKDQRPHLARRTLDLLRKEPGAQDGDGPAVLAALACAIAWNEHDTEGAEAAAREVAGLIPPAPAAGLFLSAVLGAARLDLDLLDRMGRECDPIDPRDLLKGAARACVLVEGMGLSAKIPSHLGEPLSRAFEHDDPEIDISHLVALARAAFDSELMALAYNASGVGLRQGGPPSAARFLLLRARSLPLDGDDDRRHGCLAAAAALARVQRDEALVNEAFERAEEDAPWDAPFLTTPLESMSPEDCTAVMTRESRKSRYPSGGFGDPSGQESTGGDPAQDDSSELPDPRSFLDILEGVLGGYGLEIDGAGNLRPRRASRRRGRWR